MNQQFSSWGNPGIREDRNARWLGRAPGSVEVEPADDALAAVARLEAAYAEWRGHLSAMDEADLLRPLQPVDQR